MPNNLDRDMLMKIVALVEELQSGGASIDVQINGVSIVDDGVANIPYAGDNIAGVVKVTGLAGVSMNNGDLKVNFALGSNVKQGSSQGLALNPALQHEAVFYGLAKAAGDTSQASSNNAVGVYTNPAKAYIKNMLGITAIIPLTYDSDHDTYSCDYTFAMLQAMINNGCYLVVLFNDELYLPLTSKDSTSFVFSIVGVDSGSGVDQYIVRITTDGTDTFYEYVTDTYPNSSPT